MARCVALDLEHAWATTSGLFVIVEAEEDVFRLLASIYHHLHSRTDIP